MSGHSKWSTIKRKKGAEDAKRGQLFSKLARAITLAAKQGGANPDANLRLRLAIEQAKAANMPKDNIDRAVERGSGSGAEALEELRYEGFGPRGVAVIVEAATDNRNRTAQEIKNLFSRAGGSLAGSGSVLYQFEQKGVILVEKGINPDETTLALIDLGVEEAEEVEDGIEVSVAPSQLASTRKRIEGTGIKVKSEELVYRPKNLVSVEDPGEAKKVLNFLESLDDHEDVQKVYTDFDAPDEVLSS